MDDESKRTMRLDRRLTTRPGWIPADELEREIAALPDVADKIDRQEDPPSGEDASEATGSFLHRSDEISSPPSSEDSGRPGGGFTPSN